MISDSIKKLESAWKMVDAGLIQLEKVALSLDNSITSLAIAIENAQECQEAIREALDEVKGVESGEETIYGISTA